MQTLADAETTAVMTDEMTEEMTEGADHPAVGMSVHPSIGMIVVAVMRTAAGASRKEAVFRHCTRHSRFPLALLQSTLRYSFIYSLFSFL